MTGLCDRKPAVNSEPKRRWLRQLGTSQDDGITKWSVLCSKCGASCSLYCDSEPDAVELWNMRSHAQCALPQGVAEGLAELREIGWSKEGELLAEVDEYAVSPAE